MGNYSGANIIIQFDQPNSFFFVGDVISGNITLNLHEQEMKIHEIFMTLEGKISYTTRRIMSNGKRVTHSITDYHHVPFFSTKLFFRAFPFRKKRIHL
jgi:hypothetical protein